MRRSRWGRDPILINGKPSVAQITERDVKLFQFLNRIRFMRSNHIEMLLGIHHTRLDLLHSEPNLWLDMPEKQRAQPNANYRHLSYSLSPRSERMLKDQGLYDDGNRFGDKKLYSHSMMISDMVVGLEVYGPPDQLIYWREIAARLDNPQRFIPVSITHGTKTKAFDYYNDSNGPIGLRYLDGTVRFLSIEAEHTNQVDCSNLDKTSFLKKWLAIKYIMDNKLYEKVWGIPNLLTVVGAPSQARIDTMKELIMRETNGRGATFVLFAVVPAIEDPFIKRFDPIPLYTMPLQRAGYPDLILADPK